MASWVTHDRYVILVSILTSTGLTQEHSNVGVQLKQVSEWSEPDVSAKCVGT